MIMIATLFQDMIQVHLAIGKCWKEPRGQRTPVDIFSPDFLSSTFYFFFFYQHVEVDTFIFFDQMDTQREFGSQPRKRGGRFLDCCCPVTTLTLDVFVEDTTQKRKLVALYSTSDGVIRVQPSRYLSYTLLSSLFHFLSFPSSLSFPPPSQMDISTSKSIAFGYFSVVEEKGLSFSLSPSDGYIHSFPVLWLQSIYL